MMQRETDISPLQRAVNIYEVMKNEPIAECNILTQQQLSLPLAFKV
ncbi:hypothetical protein Ngar_c18270 [Candidatus Nitrososphaera gargensis Ga9.2]|uniref:Uncharacterized protein n=1 Tax=Nitrososphaera gargensis (strain Ga9.2) TaxID=1237085 RepID=K0IG46_NITGG|nr:hypothetical protein Ngar_c18270 [Candidatus Nitrososphaera gargensis Ga9.2]